jgi:hypothetical protein
MNQILFIEVGFEDDASLQYLPLPLAELLSGTLKPVSCDAFESASKGFRRENCSSPPYWAVEVVVCWKDIDFES